MKELHPKEMILAIEGGGTKNRILLAGTDGRVLASETGGPASGLYIDRATYSRATRLLLRRVKRLADKAGGHVTIAGLAGPMDRQLVERIVTTVFGPITFVGLGESEIALALYALPWGVSLVAGTGSSCRALNERGASASCGGFGPQFGDDGSGYWIGRSAVSAVMLAHDGRGPATGLDGRLCAYYGIERVWDIFQFVDHSGHVSGPKVAGFTPHVFQAAREGDAVARAICRAAGTKLARLAIATAGKLEWRKQPVPLVLTGGVFHGGNLIMTPLKRTLRQSPVLFDLFAPAPDPSEGILKHILMNRTKP